MSVEHETTGNRGTDLPEQGTPIAREVAGEQRFNEGEVRVDGWRRRGSSRRPTGAAGIAASETSGLGTSKGHVNKETVETAETVGMRRKREKQYSEWAAVLHGRTWPGQRGGRTFAAARASTKAA